MVRAAFCALVALTAMAAASEPAGTPLGRAAEAYLADAGPPEADASAEIARVLAAADEARSSPWTFSAAIYLWATGFEGKVGAKGLTTSVDVPFSELFDDLTGAFMGRFGARRGRWGVLMDIFWCSLEDKQAGPLGGTIKTEVDLFIGELTGSYRAVEHGEPEEKGFFSLDLYAGARVWSIDTEITTTLASPGASEAWVDPIVGFDARFEIKKWLLGVCADIGGFDVGSELCWSVMAGVAYRCSRIFWLSAGYRWLDVDFESGGGPVLDAQLSGPFFAAVFMW